MPAATSCFVGNLEEKAPHAALHRRPLPGFVKFGQTAPTQLHLIDLTANVEPTCLTEPPVRDCCVLWEMLVLFLPREHRGRVLFFPRRIHGGVASKAQGATEKRVTD